MPVLDHPVHEAVRINDGHRYGCHNRRPFQSVVFGAEAYGLQFWPFKMSDECRFDRSLSDPACVGCHHQGTGEAYDKAVRSRAA